MPVATVGLWFGLFSTFIISYDGISLGLPQRDLDPTCWFFCTYQYTRLWPTFLFVVGLQALNLLVLIWLFSPLKLVRLVSLVPGITAIAHTAIPALIFLHQPRLTSPIDHHVYIQDGTWVGLAAFFVAVPLWGPPGSH